MKLGSFLFRVVFALWLCTGTQIHIATDHAALFHHATHHLAEPHHAEDASAAAYVPHDDALCCYHSPHHQHHDNGAPHAHLSDALLAGSAQRNLPNLHAAIVPLRSIAAVSESVSFLVADSVVLPPEPPASHNAALRAPPLA